MNITITTILFFIGILSYGVRAQEKNTIKVSSRVIYIDPNPTFTADVALN